LIEMKTYDYAYVVVEVVGGWGVAACVRGEDGYHPVPEYGPYATDGEARGVVDRLNERLGVSARDAAIIIASTMKGSPR
jgi:hypothetical protein